MSNHITSAKTEEKGRKFINNKRTPTKLAQLFGFRLIQVHLIAILNELTLTSFDPSIIFQNSKNILLPLTRVIDNNVIRQKTIAWKSIMHDSITAK